MDANRAQLRAAREPGRHLRRRARLPGAELTEPAHARQDRAEALLQLGRGADAEREARGALAAEPENPDLLLLLGRAVLVQGKHAEAADAARRALALDPELDPALLVLTIAQAGLGDAAAAERTIVGAIERDPEEPLYHEVHANVLLERGRFGPALEAATRARELAPTDPDAVAAQAHALAGLGRRDEAERAAREALALDPEHDRAHQVLGLVGLGRGRSADAIEGYRESLRLDPTDEAAREGLVLALKSRNPVYAVLLRFFLWQAKLPKGAQWAIALAPLVLWRVLRPYEGEPWFWPAAIALGALVVTTWAADPLSTLVLLADRELRPLVDHASRRAAFLFGGFAAAALVSALVGVTLQGEFIGQAFGLGIFALAAGSSGDVGETPRRIVHAGAAVIAAATAILVVLAAAGVSGGALVVPIAVSWLVAVPTLWMVWFSNR